MNIKTDNNNDTSYEGASPPSKRIVLKKKKLKLKNNISTNNNQMTNTSDRQYYDHINLQHIKYLLTLSDNELVDPSTNTQETKEERKRYIAGLRRWFSQMLNSKKDKHERTYTMKPCNRYYAVGNGVSFCRSNIRNFVCASYCRDYDMTNCHPTLILYLLKTNNLPHVFFQQLVDNRDKLMDEYGIVKGDILIKLNQDKPKPFTDAIIVNEAIKEWIKAKNKIIEIYKDKCLSKKYTYESSKGNPISSKCSAILCYHENLLLCRALDKYADKVSVPMYDGFIATDEICVDELNELTADYGMKWKQKDMETDLVMGEVDDIDFNSYDDLKELFEEECFLLRDCTKFKQFAPHIKDGIRWVTKDWKEIQLYYKKYQTWGDDGKLCDFTDKWIKDKKRKEFLSMDFVPYNDHIDNDPVDNDIFNIFEGFKSDYVDYNEEDIKWFLDFVNTLLDEKDGEVAEYVINYIAHLIQKPSENPLVALVLKGEKGTGKDTLGVIIETLIGNTFMCKGKGMDDIFGTWNDHLANKLVGLMNEVEGKEGIKFMEDLKERIVNKTFSIKEKFVSTKCNMAWIMRLIILSNNYTPVQTDNSDRRFMIARVNDSMHGNTEYFNGIYKNINDQNVMNKLFSYLTDRDIDNWIAKDCVPITDTYINMATRNIPPPRLYLWKRIHSENNEDCESPLIIKQSEFNKNVQEISKKVLGWKESMAKKQIKCEMERDDKYVSNKSHNFNGSGQMAYVVNNPKKYIKHLKKFDFKNYNENAVDWAEWIDNHDDSGIDSD